MLTNIFIVILVGEKGMILSVGDKKRVDISSYENLQKPQEQPPDAEKDIGPFQQGHISPFCLAVEKVGERFFH